MGPFDDFPAIVQPAEPLAPFTWFRLGGPAAFFARPRSIDDLAGLLKRSREAGLPVGVLAGGSNVLVRDQGVPGLVIHLESPAFADVAVDGPRVRAGAAVPLTALISQTARVGLAGLEALTGIPGTVGGALRGNSGNRQAAIGQRVRSVTVLDGGGEVQVRDREDIGFGHRTSDLDDPILLAAEFDLEPEDPEAVVRRMRRVWIMKKENQPYGHQSSGHIFKSPTPDLAAETLVEQSGLVGTKVGGAEISDRHANYIIAQPGATADDVLRLIDATRQAVWKQFGYELELQIQVW